MGNLKFGPAGNPDTFYALGYKRSVDMPAYLRDIDLQAYEYQLSKGVNVGEETASKIGEACRSNSICVSVHAPYYISLATTEEKTANNTANHFFKSLRAASWLNADRIVFHIGGIGKQNREDAFNLAIKRMGIIIEQAERDGLAQGIWLVPESHGKVNQLGNLTEIIAMCKIADWLAPGIDFGHMHAVSNGGFAERDAFRRVLQQLTDNLSTEQLENLHIHFSQLEYTSAGEKRHGCFGEGLGPPFEYMIDALLEFDLDARIICESAGTQAVDALSMQAYYQSRQRGE